MSADVLDVAALARDAVRALPLYTADSSACAVDVSDNTNLWGIPPAARQVLAEAANWASRYPPAHSTALNAGILRYLALGAADDVRIVTGCGSDDVIDATMRAFAEPGDGIAFSAPSFSMIPIFAKLNGLAVTSIPLTERYDVDAERLVGCGAKLTYLCSPNNPTGTSLSRDAIEYVAANARGVVLLDEAYAEFAPESFASLVERHERLLVTRTFSKAFGLAGLRLGYAVGQAPLIQLVERARGPYKVNAIAERAALAALEETESGLGWVRQHAARAVAIRDRLASALTAMGLAPLPSAANFVFVPYARAEELAAAMRAREMRVRAFVGLPTDLLPLRQSGGAGIRIGVGPWETMERVLAGLEALS
jgi:histidinol-phosphate aminotransferase